MEPLDQSHSVMNGAKGAKETAVGEAMIIIAMRLSSSSLVKLRVVALMGPRPAEAAQVTISEDVSQSQQRIQVHVVRAYG